MLNLFNELSEYITIKINSCQSSLHNHPYAENRVHSDYDLWYVVDGAVTIINGEKEYYAKKGDVILYYPDTNYIAHVEDTHCELIYVHFDFAICNNFRILDNFNFSGIIPNRLIIKESELFKEIFYQHKNNNFANLLVFKGYFTMLLSAILNIDSNEIGRMIFERNSTTKSGVILLLPVLTYISEHIKEKTSIKVLAQMINMSEKYFIFFFKNIIGIPPMQYIKQFKMNCARKYLYDQTHSIKEIAMLLGYTDAYSFSKSFKKTYGLAPSKLIKTNKIN